MSAHHKRLENIRRLIYTDKIDVRGRQLTLNNQFIRNWHKGCYYVTGADNLALRCHLE